MVEDAAIPLAGGAVTVEVTCPVPSGLLETFGPGCKGTLALGAWRVPLPAALRRPGQALFAQGRAANGAVRFSRFVVRP